MKHPRTHGVLTLVVLRHGADSYPLRCRQGAPGQRNASNWCIPVRAARYADMSKGEALRAAAVLRPGTCGGGDANSYSGPAMQKVYEDPCGARGVGLQHHWPL